jgi:hypothetical protein
LSATLQKKVPGVLTSAIPQTRELNAELVTAITTGFLKRIGHKSGLKPKRVSFEEEVYTVEVEMKKFTAIVRVDAKNREIKEYEVQPKSEEGSYSSISAKTILTIFVVSAVVNVGLYFTFKMLGV